jgi:hypothetical protein
MESGYSGITTGWQTDKAILGLKMAPKASKVSLIRNLVTRMHSSKRGMEVTRPTNGVDGRGCFKKRTPACNGQDRGLYLSLKGR